MVESTRHSVILNDAREVNLPAESVDLVVTSPPYPMIEMWDELFSKLNPGIETALNAGEGMVAFELMHEELNSVWENVASAVVDGGFVCVNIGDATRTVDGSFQLFPNTAQVIEAFRELNFHVLPRIYWQKPTNSTTAFLGSGTLPPNAYPKSEHEHILIFRKGDKKSFEPKSKKRYESAFFYEERNTWFSDEWDDVKGVMQGFEYQDGEDGVSSRDRTAAFPLELPYRLINMFSVYGDVVYDPFIGTGTTSLAAMLTGRDSIGVEINQEVAAMLSNRVSDISMRSEQLITDRIADHCEYIRGREKEGDSVSYEAENYPFGVVTRQEERIKFYRVDECEQYSESVSEGFDFLVEESVPINIGVNYTPYSQEVPVRLDRFS